MRFLITGGAGFLGSHLVDFFLKEENEVICIDNLITGTMENISHIKSNKFKFYRHDVTEYLDIDGSIDFILHFASPASPMDYLRYPIQTLKAGSLGTHKTLGLAKAKNAGYLLASTSEVYGDPLISPQSENYWGNVNPIGLRSVYDEAKRFSEAIVMAYHRFHKMNTKIARIFNTYGERMKIDDGRVIPTFIFQALKGEPLTIFGDGSQTRSFCYVSDLIEGIASLIFSNTSLLVNLGNPNEISILEVAEKIIKITKSKSKIIYKPLPEDDPKKRKPDIKRATELLSWQPKVSLDEGLEKTIVYFKKIL